MGQARPLTVHVGYKGYSFTHNAWRPALVLATSTTIQHQCLHRRYAALRLRWHISLVTVVTRPYDWDDTSHSHRSQPRMHPLSLSYHTHMVESFRTCCRWFNLCTAVYMNTRHVLRVSSLRMSAWDVAKYFLNLQLSYCNVTICAEFEEEIGIRNREAGSARGSVDINFPIYIYVRVCTATRNNNKKLLKHQTTPEALPSSRSQPKDKDASSPKSYFA